MEEGKGRVERGRKNRLRSNRECQVMEEPTGKQGYRLISDVQQEGPGLLLQQNRRDVIT